MSDHLTNQLSESDLEFLLSGNADPLLYTAHRTRNVYRQLLATMQEVERLRIAVEYYANSVHYKQKHVGEIDGVPIFADPAILKESGKIARRALSNEVSEPTYGGKQKKHSCSTMAARRLGFQRLRLRTTMTVRFRCRNGWLWIKDLFNTSGEQHEYCHRT